jgi:hypothetical protein
MTFKRIALSASPLCALASPAMAQQMIGPAFNPSPETGPMLHER